MKTILPHTQTTPLGSIYISNHVITKADETFYVSYEASNGAYGVPTTALVIGQGQNFLILKGNHLEAYANLIDLGYEACLNYFLENKELAHKYSENALTKPEYEKKMNEYLVFLNKVA